ncbi:hypothetical protein [Paraburkholderia strydomiana]|uniref:hypothetical protein n=1 Tax=Paraburkholderia strydomiana TaxID=1245417 RepID=UPI0038B6CFB8
MKSVRTQLLVGLILVLGAMSGLAGYGIFRSALEEANELFDYELRSVAIFPTAVGGRYGTSK